MINIQRWTFEELNVLPYPETRVYKQIGKAVCKQVSHPDEDLVLLVRERRMFASAPETGYRCREL